jgi:hypothetical protein
MDGVCSTRGEPSRKKTQLEVLGIDGRIILKLILKKYVGRMQAGFIWFRIWTSTGIL